MYKISSDKEENKSFFCSLTLFSEALTFTRKPENPTIVVEGWNNTNVALIWDILPASGEVIANLFLKRRRPGDVNLVNIASRKSYTAFTLLLDSFANEYRANLPATLILLNVDNTEEYVYILEVAYDVNNVPQLMVDEVTVIVRGKSSNNMFLVIRLVFFAFSCPQCQFLFK